MNLSTPISELLSAQTKHELRAALEADNYGVALGFPAKPTISEVDWILTGSPFHLDSVVAKCQVPPIYEKVFTLWRNDTAQMGTITFAPGSTTGVANITGTGNFNYPADEVRIVAPAVPDDDQENIQFLFLGSLKGAPEAPAVPVVTVPSGTYATSVTLTLTPDKAGDAIYYTIDGSTPTAESTLYEGPVEFAEDVTIKAVSVYDELLSEVITVAYVMDLPDAPVISPDGAFQEGKTEETVTITAEAGAAIYYTTNDSTPTEASTLYVGSFVVSSVTTVRAIAVKDGLTSSEAEMVYAIGIDPDAYPVAGAVNIYNLGTDLGVNSGPLAVDMSVDGPGTIALAPGWKGDPDTASLFPGDTFYSYKGNVDGYNYRSGSFAFHWEAGKSGVLVYFGRANSNVGWGIGVAADGALWHVKGGDTTALNISLGTTVRTGWNFFVGGRGVNLYDLSYSLNGAAVATYTFPTYYNVGENSKDDMSVGSSVASFSLAPWATSFYNGTVDDVRVFDSTPLTLEQILQISEWYELQYQATL